MIRILVVDDETDLELLIRQKFRHKIKEQEYDFVFAENGKVALDKLQQEKDIQLVLSDINMPEMDGLTLLGKINTDLPLVKTIIISAYGDMDNIRTAMNLGAFDFITKPVNFDDLEVTMQKTIAHVQQLQQTLKAINENNIMKMYVDEHVIQFMSNRASEENVLQNETIEASVAFIDICDFTAISEKEPADVVIRLLNLYFDMFSKEIIAHEGIIDKFMGDCLMAVFKGEQHAVRCLEACLAIRDRIESVKNDPQTGFHAKVSIGMNSGEMISGNIGSSSIRRLDYTVIGDAVNTAQRLQTIASGNQILIPAQVSERVKNLFHCESVGMLSLKNKQSSIEGYAVIAKR